MDPYHFVLISGILMQSRSLTPIPCHRWHALLDIIGMASFLSSKDLIKCYRQIPFGPEDNEKMALVTIKGQNHFRKMPFELHGVTASFQRMASVRDCNVAGINDILVYKQSWEQCLQHL